MNPRNALGFCLLCALAIAAVAAQGAFAQEAFTCAAGTTGGTGVSKFKDAHCKEATTVGAQQKFVHKAFTGSTSITGNNETTGLAFDPTLLSSVQAGVTLEIRSNQLAAFGTVQNSGGNASGTGEGFFANVTVVAPAGKGCEVVTGEVETEPLSATTAGLTNEVKFTPASGTVLATFTVTNCSIFALNHAYKLEGSVKGQTSGATTNFTKANTKAQGTLKLSGQVAELEGTVTFQGENGNGLALT